MQNQPSGKCTVNEIALDLGFDGGQKSALKDGLKKKRKVFDDLAAIGVAYVVEGKSKGAKSYLVKNG
jgi:heme oxygenase